MNQKNVILIAVAVACGLFAAFLTTRMKPAEAPQVEQVPILVAAKDLPLHTKLTKDEIDALIVPKMFTKESAPPLFVATKEEMIGKRVSRGMRAGDFFLPTDLTDKATVELPPGMDMMTIPISEDQIVGGFAVPGSRVDIIASIRIRNGTGGVILPLRRNMLVLAVNINVAPPQGGVIVGISNVSLAVTKSDALVLHAAIQRGAQMRLILLTNDKPSDYPVKWTEDEIWQVLANEFDPHAPKKEDEKKDEIVELPTPTEDLPAGTKITEELINSKFTMTKIVPPAPANVVTNIREHEGKFLTKALSASQFVPKSFVAVSMPRSGKAAPSQMEDTAKAGPDLGPPEKSDKRPPVYHDITMNTATGQRKFRYQIMPNGSTKYIGEIRLENAPEETPAEPEKDKEKEAEVKPKGKTISAPGSR